MHRDKVLVWGIGRGYQKICNALRWNEEIGNFEVLAYVSKDEEKHSLDGKKIIKPEEIQEIAFDWIIVSSEKYYQEIITYGVDALKIDRNRMLSGKIFDIPCFDWKRYLEIYRSNISIVAELCYGGILSNHLGLPFNSPFVNVRVESPEYWKMINKINEYMSISPKIKQIGKRDLNEQFLAGCIEYPLLQYDDIFLHGFHYESEQYFLCKWEQRRERFNPQLNIICKILYDEEDIDNFDKLRADTKLGFYYEELNVENIITVPFDKHFYSYSFAGCVQEFIKSKDIFSRVDIFKLLLGESGFKR